MTEHTEPEPNSFEAIKFDVSCEGCGACCSAGIKIGMTQSNVKLLGSLGTKLEKVEPATTGSRLHRLFSKKDNYAMVDGCGAYNPEIGCEVYTSPDRPDDCAKLRVGSYACREHRMNKEIDTPAEFVAWLNFTNQTQQ